MNIPSDKCTKCLKPKSSKEGSITQWINTCTCDLAVDAAAAQPQARCKTCGKTVRDNRSGSMTQWVFQQEACDCDRPVVEYVTANSTFKQAAFRGFDDQGEEEIELEPGKFPTDRYKPVAVLGSGVSGTVYLSRDRLLGKRVAVKVLRVLERDALVSFQNEAKTTSKLSHPNIVKVLDFGSTDGGVPFMVMEFVPGTSLEALIREERGLDIETTTEIFIELADALEYAHNSHILHRDLKPSNILIVETDGSLNAHLIDFGVAKMQEHLQTGTIYNGTALVGTPAYMSPDQAHGRDFDERSDIYSLGCILYETLTGEQVFSADSPLETISLHANKQPPALLDYFEKTPAIEALADIVKTCLEKSPDSRYANVSELKQALQAVPKTNASITQSSNNVDSDKESDTAYRRRKLSKLAVFAIAFFLCSTLALASLIYNDVVKIATPAPTKTKRTKLDPTNDYEMAVISSEHIEDRGASIQTALTDDTLETFALRNPGIKELSIVSSDLSPDGLRSLSMLRNLQSLSLSDVVLTRQHFQALADLPSVETLKLRPAGEDQLDDSGLFELNKSNVSSLLVKAATITNKTLSEIGLLERLTHINLDYCTGLNRAKITKLRHLPYLNRLSLSRTDATDRTVEQISRLKSLVILDLSYTEVSDSVFNDLSKSPVTKVDLVGCKNVRRRTQMPGKEIQFDKISPRELTNEFLEQ